MTEPKESIEYDFDDRTNTLTTTVHYEEEDKNLKQDMITTWKGRDAVERLVKERLQIKNQAKKEIQTAEEILEKNKQKAEQMKKGKPELTDTQKQLIEDLRVVGQFQELDKMEQENKVREDSLKKMKEGYKKDCAIFEELKKQTKSLGLKV